jgi:Lhr-like helicase
MLNYELPQKFENWIVTRNWVLRPHQIEVLNNSKRQSQLLIAPTGSGKTLSGFLPTLIELDSVEVFRAPYNLRFTFESSGLRH